MSRLAGLRHVLSGHGPLFGLVLLVGVVLNGAMATADPLIMKFLIDEGLMAGDFRSFWTWAVVFMAFGILVRLALWGDALLSQRLRNRITEALSLRTFGVFYRLPFHQVRDAERGYFLSRVYDEPAKVAQGAVQTWIGICTQLITFLAAAAVALYLSWRITLLLSLVVPLLYYLSNRFVPRIKRVSQEENEEEARLRDVLGSAIAAYTTVRLFALQRTVHERVRDQLRHFLDVLYGRVKTAKSFDTLSKVCLSLAEVTVLLAAGWGVVVGTLTIGGLFGFLKAFWQVIGAANAVMAHFSELARLNGYIERLTAFESLAVVEEATVSKRRIFCRDVDFGYNGHVVLKDLNLCIDEAERILIVGPNGSGKTTLAYLLSGFLKPGTGTLEAPPLERVSAALSPSPFIPGTLHDNVGFPSLSEAKRHLFHRMAADFGLADKVERDPSGFSAGEQKKAQIMMALLKDADVYIFDEPLANVDEASKEMVMSHQMEQTRGKIMIAIMHGDQQFHHRFGRIVDLSSPWVDGSAEALETSDDVQAHQ